MTLPKSQPISTAKLTAKLAQARETGLGDLMFLC